jgi:carotenoid cleavage dioxygenase
MQLKDENAMSHLHQNYHRPEILRLLSASSSLAAFPFLEGCDTADSSPDNPSSGTPDSRNNKFRLRDNYTPPITMRPVEESVAFNLAVVGTIPPSLLGSYMRVGPNSSTGDSPHLFLGDGMVHRVRLEGGNATMYQSRYVHTRQLENGRWLEQSDSPQDYVPGNTSLIYHAHKLLALTEMGLPYQLSPTDLSTVGVYDFGGSLKSTMTAHPKIDPITGELFFYGYSSVTPTINW